MAPDSDSKDVIVRKAFSEGDVPDFEQLLLSAVRRGRLVSREWRLHALGRDPSAFVIPLLVIQCPSISDNAMLVDVVLDIQSLVKEEWPALDPGSVAHTIPECGHLPIRHLHPQEVANDSSVQVVIVHGVRGDWEWRRAGVLMSFLGPDDLGGVRELGRRLLGLPLDSRLPGVDTLNGLECYLPLLDRGAVRRALIAKPDSEVKIGSTVVIDQDHLTDEPVVELPMEEGEDEEETLEPRRLPSFEATVPEPMHMDAHQKMASLGWDHEERPAPPLPTRRSRGKERDRGRLPGFNEERGSYGRVKPPRMEPSRPSSAKAPAYGDERWPVHVYREREIALNPPPKPSIPLKVIRAFVPDPALNFDPALTQFSLFAHGGVWSTYDVLPSEHVVNGQVEVQQLARPHSRHAERYVHDTEGVRYELPTYTHHLTTDDAGVFPVAMTALETRLMMYENSRPGAVAWYRNPSRDQPEALSVAYANPKRGTFQPTFLFFGTTPYSASMTALIDVLDQRAPDVSARLIALAMYADKYGKRFQRIESLALVDHEPRLLDLSDRKTREMLLAGQSLEEVYLSRGERVPWAEQRPQPVVPVPDEKRPLGRLGGEEALQASSNQKGETPVVEEVRSHAGALGKANRPSNNVRPSSSSDTRH